MKETMIIKNVIRCKNCGDIIESKSVHDHKSCSCGQCAVDGGHDYLQGCGNLEDWEDLSVLESRINQAIQEAEKEVESGGKLLSAKETKKALYKKYYG